MAYRHIEPVSRQLTIVIGLTVVGFMAFGLALSYYRNALFETTLLNISQQNQDLRERIDEGYRELEYYRSTQYKDKYAKENLSKINPGEQVLIITQETARAAIAESSSLQEKIEINAVAYEELLRNMPTIEHWRLYFFHPDKIEQLKRSL